ncbi:hypothetical protein HK105_205562 [Polyrhizophydium stewartii]|uniref:C2H2-type domain-containing protein n=1 Tax=Polyrhizophydium stewartii TaxID=2732419 RepID=A0ABR4N5L9_9FUNG
MTEPTCPFLQQPSKFESPGRCSHSLGKLSVVVKHVASEKHHALYYQTTCHYGGCGRQGAAVSETPAEFAAHAATHKQPPRYSGRRTADTTGKPIGAKLLTVAELKRFLNKSQPELSDLDQKSAISSQRHALNGQFNLAKSAFLEVQTQIKELVSAQDVPGTSLDSARAEKKASLEEELISLWDAMVRAAERAMMPMPSELAAPVGRVAIVALAGSASTASAVATAPTGISLTQPTYDADGGHVPFGVSRLAGSADTAFGATAPISASLQQREEDSDGGPGPSGVSRLPGSIGSTGPSCKAAEA